MGSSYHAMMAGYNIVISLLQDLDQDVADKVKKDEQSIRKKCSKMLTIIEVGGYHYY